MQKLLPLVLASLITISVVALADESMAQTIGTSSKVGTRLITLGTQGGPNPRAHRAQSSNLLIVNGALNVPAFALQNAGEQSIDFVPGRHEQRNLLRSVTGTGTCHR